MRSLVITAEAKNPYVVHVPEACGQNFYAAGLRDGRQPALVIFGTDLLLTDMVPSALKQFLPKKNLESYRPIETESCPGHEEHQARSFGVAG